MSPGEAVKIYIDIIRSLRKFHTRRALRQFNQPIPIPPRDARDVLRQELRALKDTDVTG